MQKDLLIDVRITNVTRPREEEPQENETVRKKKTSYTRCLIRTSHLDASIYYVRIFRTYICSLRRSSSLRYHRLRRRRRCRRRHRRRQSSFNNPKHGPSAQY